MVTKTQLRTSVAAALALAAVAVGPASARPADTHRGAIAVPILMYHRIDVLRPGLPEMTRRLTVDPRDFAAQMVWLKRAGFHPLTQEQLLAALLHGAALPPSPIVITFDDGYRDVYTKASAVIARLHFHAVEYVISGRVSGPDPSFLTWRQLRGLEQRGIEIGSHTVSHAWLPGLSDQEALHELVASSRALEQAVGHPVHWLAYPYGGYDARIVALAERAGYALAMTTKGGVCQSPSARLELRRVEVVDSTGVSGLRSLLDQGC